MAAASVTHTHTGALPRLCSGPAVLCWMLHVVAPTQPLVVWHCRHLLDGMSALPNGTRTTVLMGIRAAVLAVDSAAVFVACEDFAAAQALLMLGRGGQPWETL